MNGQNKSKKIYERIFSLFLTEVVKQFNKERIVNITNGARIIQYPYAKQNLDMDSYLIKN